MIDWVQNTLLLIRGVFRTLTVNYFLKKFHRRFDRVLNMSLLTGQNAVENSTLSDHIFFSQFLFRNALILCKQL